MQRVMAGRVLSAVASDRVAQDVGHRDQEHALVVAKGAWHTSVQTETGVHDMPTPTITARAC